jgi:hypothetical protein
MSVKIKKCRVCGKSPLLRNEIGLNKKFIHRKLEDFFCMSCLADYFEMSEDELKEKIEEFKCQGCTLFE